MKSVAGAIVVFSGCLLWAAGMFAISLAHVYKGNVSSGEMATWGGIAVILIGFFIIAKAPSTPIAERELN